MTTNAYCIPGEDFSRYAGITTAHIPKVEMENADLQYAAPHPGSEQLLAPIAPDPPRAWYNPRGWSLRTKLIASIVILAAIIGIIVGAVEGSRANRYPDYSPLDYYLVDTYSGSEFFDKFNYYSDTDPTFGFVQYVNQSTAQILNLTYATDSSVVLKVDTSNAKPLSGRQSVRLESKSTYDDGLFIFDILHTPYGCGTWPALWLTDPSNWPNNGEIDVLESNNKGTDGNAVTLHTTAGCDMDMRRKQFGDTIYKTCDNSTNGNAGCGVQGAPSTYGPEMNENGGGVYALELREAGIRAWFFPRNSIPEDIANSSSSPDPSKWGKALADFPNTNCDIPSHFKNQSIIANIDLCGQLGALPQFYTEMYNCPATCHDFVLNNAANFTQAYWEFRSFRVYQAVS